MQVSFQLDHVLLTALQRKCPRMALSLVVREALRQYVSTEPVLSNEPVVSDKPVVRDTLTLSAVQRDQPVVRDTLTLSAVQRDRVLRYAKLRGVSPQMMLSMCLDVGLDLFSLPPMYSVPDK
jgi:hypothetical protein